MQVTVCMEILTDQIFKGLSSYSNCSYNIQYLLLESAHYNIVGVQYMLAIINNMVNFSFPTEWEAVNLKNEI